MLDQPVKQWLTGRKRGEDGNTKILKGYHLVKNKKLMINSAQKF